MLKIPTEIYHTEQLIKRSRFIGWCGHCESGAEAETFLKTHTDPSATHNCWAWKIGQEYRSTDDGEPGGTAGRPILRAIESSGFDQTIVLVIRFYGGIKLGAGGLARAYGGCASECLSHVRQQPLIEYSSIDIFAPFDSVNLVHQLCEQHAAIIEKQVWETERCIFNARVPASELSLLRNRLFDSSHGKVRLQANDLALFGAVAST